MVDLRRGRRPALARRYAGIQSLPLAAAACATLAVAGCELSFSTRTRGIDPEDAAAAGGSVGRVLGGPVGESIGSTLGLVLAGGVGAYAIKKRGDANRAANGNGNGNGTH